MQRSDSKGAIAEAGGDLRLEGFDGRAVGIDPDDFGKLRRAGMFDADAFAEFEEGRQSGEAIIGGRDLGDDAADSQPGQFLEAEVDGVIELGERIHRDKSSTLGDRPRLKTSCRRASSPRPGACIPNSATHWRCSRPRAKWS